MAACGAKTVGYQEKTGCMSVRAHWMHWPCLIPQHGPGSKHHRKIELMDWQQEMIDGDPQRFPRGLFHADGSRFVKTVVHNGKQYRYPRYMFVNESSLSTNRATSWNSAAARSLDQVDVAWWMSRHNTLSVARRAAVARLDDFVGPKW